MQEFFEALRQHAKYFGPRLAQRAYERGLAVTSADGTTRPIPVTATPVVFSQNTLSKRAQLSSHLASAGFKMAQAVLQGSQHERLFGAMSPLERSIAEATHREVSMLATTRVDYFLDGLGQAKALELNATIPAMQGYSDIAAHTFIETLAEYTGMPAQESLRLKNLNGSNARALFEALQQGHFQKKGKTADSIALLCRRHDAQHTEVTYLRDRFREWGVHAEVVYPDELSRRGHLEAHGKPFDLLYRHLFVRRLEEKKLSGAALVADIFRNFNAQETVILNPPISQVEIKTTFALLSSALSEARWAQEAKLSSAELEAISECVPWTRPFVAGPTEDPEGNPCRDLIERVSDEPERFVLKRAWDYGGRAVFVGATVGQPWFEERVRTSYGRDMSWRELCQACAQDSVGGGFVVQDLVESPPKSHVLCEGPTQREALLYVDFSAYASVGLNIEPSWGGVCRGSTSRIVNIVGGGGVLPLLREEVAEILSSNLMRKSANAPAVGTKPS